MVRLECGIEKHIGIGLADVPLEPAVVGRGGPKYSNRHESWMNDGKCLIHITTRMDIKSVDAVVLDNH